MRLARGKPVTMVVSSGPRLVVLDLWRYLGKPLDTVRAAMIRLGLRGSVTGRASPTDAGVVIAINPSGSPHQGDSVTVTVATSARPLASCAGTGKGSCWRGGGRTLGGKTATI